MEGPLDGGHILADSFLTLCDPAGGNQGYPYTAGSYGFQNPKSSVELLPEGNPHAVHGRRKHSTNTVQRSLAKETGERRNLSATLPNSSVTGEARGFEVKLLS